MLHYIDHAKMGHSHRDWLDSQFHFSFAEYFKPDNIRFGILRVVNDDIVQPGAGFTTHPHRDMEILSYVVSGKLSHKDNLGNAHTLGRGQAQYMSAGTGVTHSEYNWGSENLRFLQIWLFPDKSGYRPDYGDFPFAWEDRVEKWLPLATGYDNEDNGAPIKLHADAHIYTAFFPEDGSIELKVGRDRQAYMILLEGEADVEGLHINTRDAVEVLRQDVTINAKAGAHILVVEMAYDGKAYRAKFEKGSTLRNWTGVA